jgi:CheY-like chemotaxis protein
VLHLEGADPSPVYVRGEELLCYSIAANLVKNAIEASHAGDRVDVRLTSGSPVTLTIHNPSPVAPDIAGRFFDKYVTRGKRGGTGLGTYSARLMARAQKGDVSLRTSAATGTTLTLSLPPSRGQGPVSTKADTPQPARASWTTGSPSRSVLLVDDDELNRFVTLHLLPSPPFTVTTATDGHEAVEAMSRHWPDYLLLDMEMPGMNGLETLHWVRDQEATQGRPRCRVVMISGHDDAGSAARAIEAGAQRFLVKPLSRDRLLATLAELESDRG